MVGFPQNIRCCQDMDKVALVECCEWWGRCVEVLRKAEVKQGSFRSRR